MDFEFETTRTALANAFAAAGAELLSYQPLASTAVAAIPDTQPQKYAVAGTLKGILSMAGKMMGEDGAEQPTGDLTDEQIDALAEPLMSQLPARFALRQFDRAAIAAYLARQAQAEQEQWTTEPPTERGEYWHWTGDDAHAPMIYHVLWSGLAKKCFVSIGQYDIKSVIWCDKFGGKWMKIEQPSTRSPAAPVGTQNVQGGAQVVTKRQVICASGDALLAGFKPGDVEYDLALVRNLGIQIGDPSAGAQNAEAIRNQADSAPVISSYDLEKVKSLKFKFVDSLIHSGVQYRTCGAISATLNQIIADSEAAAAGADALQTGSANTQEGGASAERSGE
jgi:hypothetical protein